MIKVNNSINNAQTGPYVYYVNGAVLFSRIYGSYKVDDKVVNFFSGTMVLGQTFTLNMPSNARELTVTIESSAYFLWRVCYNEYFEIPKDSLCLYTLGVIWHVACFDAPCNNKIESAIVRYLLENPIDYRGFNAKENSNNCCFNNNYCNNICDKCSSSCQDVQNIYMTQIKNYIKVMKNYLPKDIFCSLKLGI